VGKERYAGKIFVSWSSGELLQVDAKLLCG